MIVKHRAQLEAADGGFFTVQALDDILTSLQPFVDHVRWGTGTPLNRVVGSIGDVYLRTDGSTTTTLYVKESGMDTKTGWVAK